jgi:hypothetical protein
MCRCGSATPSVLRLYHELQQRQGLWIVHNDQVIVGHVQLLRIPSRGVEIRGPLSRREVPPWRPLWIALVVLKNAASPAITRQSAAR